MLCAAPARGPARRPGNTSCFFRWPFPVSPAVHFLFLSPFKRRVDAGERRTERWGGAGYRGASDPLWALHAIKDDKAAL